jgi:hypothetical protein
MFTFRRANRAPPTEPEAGPEEERASAAVVEAPQPPSLVAGIGEVVTTFFASMLPPMAEAF